MRAIRLSAGLIAMALLPFDRPVAETGYGVGVRDTCAEFIRVMEPEFMEPNWMTLSDQQKNHRLRSLDWLAGIFTGMNIARGPGKQVDLPELDDLVRAILADCQDSPATPWVTSFLNVYLGMHYRQQSPQQVNGTVSSNVNP